MSLTGKAVLLRAIADQQPSPSHFADACRLTARAVDAIAFELQGLQGALAQDPADRSFAADAWQAAVIVRLGEADALEGVLAAVPRWRWLARRRVARDLQRSRYFAEWAHRKAEECERHSVFAAQRPETETASFDRSLDAAHSLEAAQRRAERFSAPPPGTLD